MMYAGVQHELMVDPTSGYAAGMVYKPEYRGSGTNAGVHVMHAGGQDQPHHALHPASRQLVHISTATCPHSIPFHRPAQSMSKGQCSLSR